MPALSPTQAERLAALRAEVRAIESAGAAGGCEYLPFRVEEMDRRLAGGGLAVAALHEVTGERPSLGDDSAALLFTTGIARMVRVRKPVARSTAWLKRGSA